MLVHVVLCDVVRMMMGVVEMCSAELAVSQILDVHLLVMMEPHSVMDQMIYRYVSGTPILAVVHELFRIRVAMRVQHVSMMDLAVAPKTYLAVVLERVRVLLHLAL